MVRGSVNFLHFEPPPHPFFLFRDMASSFAFLKLAKVLFGGSTYLNSISLPSNFPAAGAALGAGHHARHLIHCQIEWYPEGWGDVALLGDGKALLVVIEHLVGVSVELADHFGAVHV